MVALDTNVVAELETEERRTLILQTILSADKAHRQKDTHAKHIFSLQLEIS